jgi:type II secretory pathway pseudopilin PulG
MLAELVLVLGIISIIFGFITVNLGRVTRVTGVLAASEVLTSDLRAQQEKAMNGVGETEGLSFGIFFEQDRYILFSGSTYSSSDPDNVPVILGEDVTFTDITFPQNQIVFSPRSGEIAGFNEAESFITVLSSIGSEQKTMRINKYGAVDQFK